MMAMMAWQKVFRAVPEGGDAVECAIDGKKFESIDLKWPLYFAAGLNRNEEFNLILKSVNDQRTSLSLTARRLVIDRNAKAVKFIAQRFPDVFDYDLFSEIIETRNISLIRAVFSTISEIDTRHYQRLIELDDMFIVKDVLVVPVTYDAMQMMLAIATERGHPDVIDVLLEFSDNGMVR